MSKTIPLAGGRGWVAVVDDADYDDVSQYKWHLNKSTRGRPYARRNIWRDGRKETVYLSRHILGADDGKQIEYINGDTLDCRRENLRFRSVWMEWT